MKTLILISGKARSGKNTAAEMLKKEFEGFKVIEDMFAKSLKQIAEKATEKLQQYLETVAVSSEMWMHGEDYAEVHKHITDKLVFSKENFYDKKTPLTRILLEMIGTDIIREIDPNFHVTNLINRSKTEDFDIKLVTDARFKNEIEETYPARVFTLRINRTDVPENNHISNTELDNYEHFDFEIKNDGTLEDLEINVKAVAAVIRKKISN